MYFKLGVGGCNYDASTVECPNVRGAQEHKSHEARGQMCTRAEKHTAREAHWQRGTRAERKNGIAAHGQRGTRIEGFRSTQHR